MKIDLCKMLRVEEGEEFKVNDKYTIYFITDNVLQYKIKNECNKAEKCVNCKFYNVKHITEDEFDVCLLEIDPCKWNIEEIKRRLKQVE